MGYTPQTWDASTPLTTARLNYFENQYQEMSELLAGHVHDDMYYATTQMQATFWYAGNDGSGSGACAATIDGYTKTQLTAAVPTGLVIWWYGTIASIPAGWHLCDGTAGTIDLQETFVVGAGLSYAVGASGGYATRAIIGTLTVASHVLTEAEMPRHRHSLVDYYGDQWDTGYFTGGSGNAGTLASAQGYTDYAGGGEGHGHPGSTINGVNYNNYPPNIALCCIQKL